MSAKPIDDKGFRTVTRPLSLADKILDRLDQEPGGISYATIDLIRDMLLIAVAAKTKEEVRSAIETLGKVVLADRKP